MNNNRHDQFLPNPFLEYLMKECKTPEIRVNRPENIRQEFWAAIDDIVYLVGKSRDISLSLNLTPNGVLNANVYPWPEDEDNEDEDFEGEERK